MSYKGVGLLFKFTIGERSIFDSSIMLYHVLKSLKSVDTIFSNPIIGKEKSSEFTVDFSLSDDENIAAMANSLIEVMRKDIKKYSGTENPTIDYKRGEGFQVAITYKQGTSKISFLANVGALNGCGMWSIANNHENNSYSFYREVIHKVSLLTFVNVAVIRLNEPTFVGKVKDYEFPFGWITYLSRDYFPEVLQIDVFKIEINQNGVIYILTDKVVILDDELYSDTCNQLLNLMKKIENFFPNYKIN